MMSGYKRATVTISEQEYRRLHETDMRRRFRGHTKAKTRISGQAPDLANTLRQMENRQRQLEEAFGSLDQSFSQSEAETETMQEILMQNALCYESLAAIVEETASNAGDSLARLSQHFTEAMDREREQFRTHLCSLVQRLDTYEQREQVRAEAARRWLRQTVILADFIQVQFNHERFRPGKLSRIFQSLNFAQNNLAQGFHESSLQVSQQAFIELSELHFELEQCTVEWQNEYEKAHNAINHILSDLELNPTVNGLGLQGEELTEQVDLDYWTEGKYRHLLDVCRKVMTRLVQDQQHLSTEELTRIQTELLPVMTERFESIVYEARLNALNSQLRMNIAEKALQALEIHGFKLNDSGYANKDMRAPFMAVLENSDGSHVSIQVLPKDPSTQELTNELVVVTNHPYLKTEQEARLQWEELCRSLNQYNLDVSRPEVRAAPAVGVSDPIQQPILLNQPATLSKRQNNVR
jgi:hypothetical protein